jgi:hypothetical protein
VPMLGFSASNNDTLKATRPAEAPCGSAHQLEWFQRTAASAGRQETGRSGPTANKASRGEPV